MIRREDKKRQNKIDAEIQRLAKAAKRKSDALARAAAGIIPKKRAKKNDILVPEIIA